MELILGGLVLTSEHSPNQRTRIKISKGGVDIADIDSRELIFAIEALEESCWGPWVKFATLTTDSTATTGNR